MARVPFIAGNWKLNKTVTESLALVTEIKNAVASVRDVEVAVAPVFTALQAVGKRLEGTSIGLAAQDCYFEDSGAWTGQVSVPLLKDVGCTWVIVGHSERRQHFGETLQERDSNQTLARVGTQLHAALEGLGPDEARRVVIAYEPVWAIGTGRNATPAQAQEVHAFIRKELRTRYSEVADEVRIQYGGSVKPDNIATLMAEPDIDGALVGGASLTADSFIKLVRGGQQRLRRG